MKAVVLWKSSTQHSALSIQDSIQHSALSQLSRSRVSSFVKRKEIFENGRLYMPKAEQPGEIGHWEQNE
jgi:hypothetical protein